ncbi:Protein kinase [Vanrija albida]|uniref:non-specific serine/threonine protein kinase n=1 Tax=Vanrija albida TaxID=181172 RepID=A0ABR3Q1Y7_9TREE
MASRPAPPVPSSGRSRRDVPPGATDPRSSRPKPRIGQYIIERTLGTGSFGKVKLATHAITGHQVALKLINRSKITTPDMNARVKREIQYLKVLRHPHIIKLYEVITTPTDVIMVMEYAGEELFNYIVAKGKGGMDENEARRFFQQMIGAIEYCHRHHIVHRDLKPENLFLDSHNNIKIGDFGLSNLMTDGDFLKTSCGSPNYAAPEVISGKLYSGPEIDVWSAGVIMYVLLCGKLPFDDDHIPSLFKKIESGIYSMPSHVSKEAQHVLRRMLVVDPVKRATINEIRQMPFFLENLPNYLQPLPATPMTERYPTLPMGDLSTLLLINEGQADPKKIAEAKGLTWTEDLGIIDPDIVEELLQKISTYTPEMVKDALQKPGDNQVKVAYQLVRDHKQIVRDSLYSFDDEDQSAMEDFLASSPPAWNVEIPHHQQPLAEDENDLDEVDPEIQDIPNAHFDVLDSSLPGKSTPPGGETREQEDAERAAHALLSPPEPPIPNFETKPLQKPRWHFGIRSRSPPMEVLLEIYRVLQQIGMEWKLKDVPLPEIGPVPPGGQGYTEEVDDALARYQAENPDKEVVMGKRPPGKKEAAAIEKAAQSLFLIETRARYDNTLIRMDLQLFFVDNSNFLVDFRNVSYTPVPPADGEEPTRPKGAALGGAGVSGPFQFLEMACQLIAELASG